MRPGSSVQGMAVGCVAALAIGPPAAAQGGADADPVPTAADSTVVAQVPLRVDLGNVFVDVLVNGSGPHTFLLDTGSPVTAIDRGVARRLDLDVRSIGTASGAGGDSVPAGRVDGVAVRIGSQRAAPDGVVVLPLDSLMSPAADRAVDGVVGYPFFRGRVVEIDFRGRSLRVHDRTRYRYDGPGHRIRMTVRNGWPVLEGVADLPDLGPTPVELMVDLGSRGNVLFTTPFVRRYRLVGLLRDTARATLGKGLGGAARFLLARVDGVQLGDLWLEDVVAGFSTGRALPFRQFGGVIGTGVLRRYRMVLDYPGGELILEEQQPDSVPAGGGAGSS